ncbi:MAG: acyl-CoA/acyl-ACP dehydrogenase, partial [Microbacteriaceae bacterium]|nr:acyl-CoA/acyl-ACP dehydrogenase [Burkholderiaceae bacterium]
MRPMFPLTDTQTQLQDSLARWLADHAPFERRAALLATPEAIAPLWRGLTHELGLLSAALPEAAGGLGGGLADHLVILQALGHALLP